MKQMDETKEKISSIQTVQMCFL